MNLCGRAIEIRERWALTTLGVHPMQAASREADRARLARKLNAHIARCAMCSK